MSFQFVKTGSLLLLCAASCGCYNLAGVHPKHAMVVKEQLPECSFRLNNVEERYVVMPTPRTPFWCSSDKFDSERLSRNLCANYPLIFGEDAEQPILIDLEIISRRKDEKPMLQTLTVDGFLCIGTLGVWPYRSYETDVREIRISFPQLKRRELVQAVAEIRVGAVSSVLPFLANKMIMPNVRTATYKGAVCYDPNPVDDRENSKIRRVFYDEISNAIVMGLSSVDMNKIKREILLNEVTREINSD